MVSGQNILEYHIVWLRIFPLISFSFQKVYNLIINYTVTMQLDLMKANFMPYGILT